MNFKRIIFGSVIILLLSTLFHSVYDKFPSTLTSLFFPVNESIWEHNKMILLAYFVYAIFLKVIFKKDRSYIYLSLIECISCIVILDVTFTPVYLYVLNTQDNIVVTIIFYIISIILSFIIGEKFLMPENKKLELGALVGFVIISIVFMILTYHPLDLAIFKDFSK